MTGTHLYRSFSFPSRELYDGLIVMGGPMGVYDERQYPWLTEEIRFIEKSIRHGKAVLGICLGAQLIARVLGAGIHKNHEPEIGWFPVHASNISHALLEGIPDTITVFQWHGDTFDLPENSMRLFQSEICPNQAFAYEDRILALQFHMESTTDSIQKLIRHASEDIKPGPFVQSPEEMLNGAKQNEAILQNHCDRLLDRWAGPD